MITGHATTTIGSGASVSFVRSNPVMKWSDLQEYADFMREFVAAAQAAKKAGKSADDAVKSLNLPAKYKDYNMARAAEDVQMVYDESKLARASGILPACLKPSNSRATATSRPATWRSRRAARGPAFSSFRNGGGWTTA